MVAGPAMSGMPSGTTPKSSGRFFLSWDGFWISSRDARMKRMSPPAIWKSALADADRDEDAPAKDEEKEGHDPPCPRRLVRYPPSLLNGDIPAERQEDGRQPHRVHRHEKRDEALQEFSDKFHVRQPASGRLKGNPPCAARTRGAQFKSAWKPHPRTSMA